LIFELSAMDGRLLRDTRITPIIAMILSSEKRVCLHSRWYYARWDILTLIASVCVSSLVVDEIKQMIKDSEIMK
jgi:hypothetical protein